MAAVVIVIAVLIALGLMPKKSRVLNFALIISFILFLLYLEFGTDGKISFNEFKGFVTFITLIVGLFLLSSLLAVVRLCSETELLYKKRKAKLLSFLVKWGVIYVIFNFSLRAFLYCVLGVDWNTTWVITKVYGSMTFIACLAIYFIWFRSAKSQSEN